MIFDYTKTQFIKNNRFQSTKKYFLEKLMSINPWTVNEIYMLYWCLFLKRRVRSLQPLLLELLRL